MASLLPTGREMGPRAKLQNGFTYLGLLAFVAIMGISLAGAGVIWRTVQQREKEQELLFIGGEFRRAIGAYYEKTPGPVKKYPQSLEDLLTDDRQLVAKRYLRKIYVDPMTGKGQWGMVNAPAGGVMGVHSLSEDEPLKSGNFGAANKDLEGKRKYSEWLFVYVPSATLSSAPGAAKTGQSPVAVPPLLMGSPSK